MWHIDPLLGNDGETKNETRVIARQRPARNNGSAVGSGVIYGSAPRLYHSIDRVGVVQWSAANAVQLSELVRDLAECPAVGSQLVQLGSCSDSQQGLETVNTETGGSTTLEAVVRQRLATAD
jgi:hypothetical protein